MLDILAILAVFCLAFNASFSSSSEAEPPFPFVLENNEIQYAEFATLGSPCYYLMSGHVFDLNNEPFLDYVVNIQMLTIEDVAPELGYAFPYTEHGFTGRSSLLPSWEIDYEVWLTDAIGGNELSAHVVVPSRDCHQNWAIIDFVQIAPIP